MTEKKHFTVFCSSGKAKGIDVYERFKKSGFGCSLYIGFVHCCIRPAFHYGIFIANMGRYYGESDGRAYIAVTSFNFTVILGT